MNRDDLVLDNINLIYFVIQKMGLLDKKEIYYDSGIIALVRAAQEFDESKGYNFSTFATTAIYNEICKDIKASKTDKRKANYNTLSLDMEIGEEEDATLLDLIPSNVDVEKEVIRKIQREEVYKAIQTLTNKEKQILKYYVEGNLNQGEIARILGNSQAYVSRRLQIIAEKLRKKIERR